MIAVSYKLPLLRGPASRGVFSDPGARRTLFKCVGSTEDTVSGRCLSVVTSGNRSEMLPYDAKNLTGVFRVFLNTKMSDELV